MVAEGYFCRSPSHIPTANELCYQSYMHTNEEQENLAQMVTFKLEQWLINNTDRKPTCLARQLTTPTPPITYRSLSPGSLAVPTPDGTLSSSTADTSVDDLVTPKQFHTVQIIGKRTRGLTSEEWTSKRQRTDVQQAKSKEIAEPSAAVDCDLHNKKDTSPPRRRIRRHIRPSLSVIDTLRPSQRRSSRLCKRADRRQSG